MTAPGGLLDFFALEAAEHLDRLDVLASASAGPEPDALHKHARALRGSATMAKVPLVADLSGALERVARYARDTGAPWGAGQRSAIVSAVDELRRLVRTVKALTPEDDARARALAAELDAFAPRATPVATPIPDAGSLIARDAKELSVAIAMLRTRPADPAALAPLADRVRRLRGTAELKDFPPLPEIVEGIERALRPLEQGAGMRDQILEVLVAADAVLTDAAQAIDARAPLPTGPMLDAFVAALDRLTDGQRDADRIVPISALYYADGAPDVIAAAPNPPTSRAERFRLEAVSLAEHLRRLIGDARSARDSIARDRLGRELRGAVVAFEQVARSFDEHDVATLLAAHVNGAAALSSASLDALDAAAVSLADPKGELRPSAAEAAAPTAAAAPTPVAAPAPAAAPTSAPTAAPAPASGLQSLLAQGLAGLGGLATAPLAAPTAVEDDTIVPIERLLYRGRAALERAQSLRDEIRRNGTPSAEQLHELYDLLDLVGTE
jgi:chemotaxis protein histidine kinase CheA